MFSIHFGMIEITMTTFTWNKQTYSKIVLMSHTGDVHLACTQVNVCNHYIHRTIKSSYTVNIYKVTHTRECYIDS